MKARSVLTLSTVTALLTFGALPAHADGITADLALLSLTADAQRVHVHQVVSIVATGVDLGPDAVVNDSLDVVMVDSQGLRLVDMTCSGGISPDTPFCEFGETAVGEQVTATVTAVVTAAAARTGTVSVTFCAQDESATGYLTDPDSSNNCRTLVLSLRGH